MDCHKQIQLPEAFVDCFQSVVLIGVKLQRLFDPLQLAAAHLQLLRALKEGPEDITQSNQDTISSVCALISSIYMNNIIFDYISIS